MKIGAFTLENMADADLENLYLSAQAERIRRADNKRKRTAWVNKYYHQYQLSIANSKRIGETTVVAVKWMDGVRMGVATPVNGDVFDVHTGIAVAYAKACGEHIPDFV